ncbi:MAG: HAD-IIA family hydrolase [Dermatophilaceae bacterium]
MTARSGSAPLRGIEAVVCDLDGVVYRGAAAVPHAVEVLTELGLPVLYLTNNASRSAAEVAQHLVELGLDVSASDVVTSAQGAADLVARTRPGAAVLPVGGPGLRIALEEAGLTVVSSAEDADTVVQGYGPRVSASDLAEASYAVAHGAWWVATNTDATIPNERGIAPGNGALVGAVERAVGRGPDTVVGKPNPDLYELASARLGVAADHVLAVGDRLDTDIAGANSAGMPSVLVLTGVSTRAEAVGATPDLRPTYVIEDLRELLKRTG